MIVKGFMSKVILDFRRRASKADTIRHRAIINDNERLWI